MTTIGDESFDYLRFRETFRRSILRVDDELGKEMVGKDHAAEHNPNAVQYAILDEGMSVDDFLDDMREAYDSIAKANGRPTIGEHFSQGEER